jgi:hypothetical protein
MHKDMVVDMEMETVVDMEMETAVDMDNSKDNKLRPKLTLTYPKDKKLVLLDY